jgi:putative transcriptional regulator
MIRHHPPFDLVVDYATGVAGEGIALAVAAHASLCPACRAQIRNIEAIGGALLNGIEPEPVSEDLLTTLMNRLDEELEPEAGAVVADAETRKVIPAPLLPYVATGLDKLPWRSVGRLFQEFRLPLASKDVKASLMKLRPGSLMPQHTHRGQEITLVLAGGYRDGEEQFLRGDFSVRTPSDVHQPVADDDGPCLCLAVLDAPLKLTGAVGRLVNPFLRI